MGVLREADGSAYFELGNTKVVAAVYGPREVRRGRAVHDRAVVNCEFSMATFSTGERRKRSKGDKYERGPARRACRPSANPAPLHVARSPRATGDLSTLALRSSSRSKRSCRRSSLRARRSTSTSKSCKPTEV